MSKTSVDRGKFEKILKELGLGYVEQSGYLRVDVGKGYRMYVAKSQNVRRVDLAEFVPPAAEYPKGFRRLGEGERFGAVSCQLDFTLPEADILTAFRAAAEYAITLGQAEPRKRVAPMAPKTRTLPEKMPSVVDRRKLIEEAAKRMGASISQKTLDEWNGTEPPVAAAEPSAEPAPTVFDPSVDPVGGIEADDADDEEIDELG